MKLVSGRPRTLPGVVVLLTSAILLTLAAVPMTSAAASTQLAARAETVCKYTSFIPSIRRVQGTRRVTLTRASVQSYPFRTVVRTGTRYTTDSSTNIRASINGSVTAEAGVSATLKKVVGLYAKASGTGGWETGVRLLRRKSSYISVTSTMTIPGSTSAVWFEGYQTVGGTYQKSTCADDGGSPAFGTVQWRTNRWTSFRNVQDTGGQRCDRAPQTPAARVAKARFCL